MEPKRRNGLLQKNGCTVTLVASSDKTIHCVFVFNEARKLAASPATRGRPHRACAAGWTSAGPCLPQASVLGDAMVYATAVLGEFAKRVTKPMMAS